jgi:hypothetical protein
VLKHRAVALALANSVQETAERALAARTVL